jgi:hypothetical protein
VFTSSPVLLATTTANGAGAINASVTIPSDAEAGSHTLSATGADPVGGTLVLRASLTVEGSTGSILGLPRTGGNIAALAIVAAAIFLVGGLFDVVTRRRTAHAES